MSKISGHRQQRGFAMLAIVALVTLVSIYLIVNAFSRSNAEVALDRNQRTMNALTEAKAALIAYSASQAWSSGTNDQPGSLPCPAADDNGSIGACTSSAATRIGRLPWKSIGTRDLRDASGEILWYALSANFRKASGTTVINSDTQGTLTINGAAPASTVVAVLIAPGQALAGQNRSVSNVANFLEGINASGTDTFLTATQPSDTFNDQLIPITHADLFSVVEPAVAARIERDIKPYLSTYFTQWNAFPYPSKFDNPDPGTNGAGTTRAQAAYLGDTSKNSGLLPITSAVTYPWSAGSVTLIGGIGAVAFPSCNTVTSPNGLQCTFGLATVLGLLINPRLRVQGNIGSNAGISFPKLPGISEVQSNVPLTSATISGTLTSGGAGTVIYEATYVCTLLCVSPVTIMIPDVVVSPFTGNAWPDSKWFITNEWYRQVYYAVSPGYLPGGGAACNPLPATPSCLTVNNMPAYYASPNTNKRAILVLAGRALNGATRPSSSLTNYFEGQNPTPGDFIYEHRSGVPTSINDKVVVVCPDATFCP